MRVKNVHSNLKHENLVKRFTHGHINVLKSYHMYSKPDYISSQPNGWIYLTGNWWEIKYLRSKRSLRLQLEYWLHFKWFNVPVWETHGACYLL